MALHTEITTLLRESLPEYVEAARYCVNYKKDSKWGNQQVGGCLGYSGAALMLSIADCIGSYHRGNTKYLIPVEGDEIPIVSEGFQHFYIFNSEYYQLGLPSVVIKKIYANFRNLLLHNAALAYDHFLCARNDRPPLFSEDGKLFINVVSLLKVSESAVKKFLMNLDKVVPNSQQLGIIKLKS